MSSITVTMKNGEKKKFADGGAAGRNYYASIKYKIGFVVIEDAYGNHTSIPSDKIENIYQETSKRRGW